MIQRIERQFAGRPLTLEIGRMARLAGGSCLVQYGETTVLCTATAQPNPTHIPFFPLTVEYREKTYAAGKIPGGFFKREGRPGEKETLSARQIDRPLRSLFPEDYKNETQVACFVNAARHLRPGGRFVVEVGVPKLAGMTPSSTAYLFVSRVTT